MSPGRPRKAPRKAAPRRRMIKAKIVRRVFNPAPVFTETFLCRVNTTSGLTSTINANNGFMLATSMAQMPERAQYAALYTKYKILNFKWLLLPQFGSAEQNAASGNNGAGQPSTSNARIVFAIQDSPIATATGVPASEQEVLEENGCRIRTVKDKLSIRHKPVPELQLANGIYETEAKSPFINFDVVGGYQDPYHYGVSGWISQQVNVSGPAIPQGYVVYCKMTFQLKDPR